MPPNAVPRAPMPLKLWQDRPGFRAHTPRPFPAASAARMQMRRVPELTGLPAPSPHTQDSFRPHASAAATRPVETLATVAYRPVRPGYGDDLQAMRSLRSTDPAHLRLDAESRWDVDVLHVLVVLDGHPNPNPPSCRKGRGDTSRYLKLACQRSRERVATRKTVPQAVQV